MEDRTLGVPPLALFMAFLSAVPLAAAQGEQNFERWYTASAYISFLSIPIFSRSGVGFGFASSNEHVQGEERMVSLRFLSGSTPESAHGLNRFGFIQENIEQIGRATVEANYFGLMTASGEESLADGKAALTAKTRDEVPFVAAQAVINRETARYSVRHMLLPSSYRGSNADQLLRQVQAEFRFPLPDRQDHSEAGQTMATFLNSLREAMQTDGADYDRRFVYNGNTFRLHAEKRRDLKTGEELRKAALTTSANAVMLMNATIRNEKTNEPTNFRLWFEAGSPNFLPLRFEFKPKSYLRLVFDAEPAHGRQTLSLNRGIEP